MGKSTPVLSSNLSSAGHSHPISSISIVGNQNNNFIISSSSDGTVCTWQMDMLAKPHDTIKLYSQNNRSNEVAVTALKFRNGETSIFWTGTEQGSIFQVNRLDRAGMYILIKVAKQELIRI
jgi:dynein intermediate chain